jgi:hypothetical protein
LLLFFEIQSRWLGVQYPPRAFLARGIASTGTPSTTRILNHSFSLTCSNQQSHQVLFYLQKMPERLVSPGNSPENVRILNDIFASRGAFIANSAQK